MAALEEGQGLAKRVGIGTRLEGDDDHRVQGRVLVGQDLGELESPELAAHPANAIS